MNVWPFIGAELLTMLAADYFAATAFLEGRWLAAVVFFVLACVGGSAAAWMYVDAKELA
jgi:hypothetical protein